MGIESAPNPEAIDSGGTGGIGGSEVGGGAVAGAQAGADATLGGGGTPDPGLIEPGAPGGVGGVQTGGAIPDPGLLEPAPVSVGGVQGGPSAPSSASTAFAIETPGFGGTYGYSGPGGSFVALGNPQGAPISSAQAQALSNQLGVDVSGNIVGSNPGLGQTIISLIRSIPVIGLAAGFARRLNPNFEPGIGAAAQGRADAGRSEAFDASRLLPISGGSGPAAAPTAQTVVNPFTMAPVATAPTVAGGGGGGGGFAPAFTPATIPTTYGTRLASTSRPWAWLGLLLLIVIAGYTYVHNKEKIGNFIKGLTKGKVVVG